MLSCGAQARREYPPYLKSTMLQCMCIRIEEGWREKGKKIGLVAGRVMPKEPAAAAKES